MISENDKKKIVQILTGKGMTKWASSTPTLANTYSVYGNHIELYNVDPNILISVMNDIKKSGLGSYWHEPYVTNSSSTRRNVTLK